MLQGLKRVPARGAEVWDGSGLAGEGVIPMYCNAGVALWAAARLGGDCTQLCAYCLANIEYSSLPECSCDAQLRQRGWCSGGSAAKEGFGGSQQPCICSGAQFVLHCIFSCWDASAGACKMLAAPKGKKHCVSLP